MKQAKLLILAAFPTIAACAPAANTDDQNANELIDLVVRSEAPFHQCVEIGGQTLVVDYPADYPAPIMGIYPGAFSDAGLNLAASNVAVEVDRMIEAQSIAEIGAVRGEPDWIDRVDGTRRCNLHVGYPTIEDDHAFIKFSEPGGDIGAYGFKRISGRWKIVERLHFGWW